MKNNLFVALVLLGLLFSGQNVLAQGLLCPQGYNPLDSIQAEYEGITVSAGHIVCNRYQSFNGVDLATAVLARDNQLLVEQQSCFNGHGSLLFERVNQFENHIPPSASLEVFCDIAPASEPICPPGFSEVDSIEFEYLDISVSSDEIVCSEFLSFSGETLTAVDTMINQGIVTLMNSCTLAEGTVVNQNTFSYEQSASLFVGSAQLYCKVGVEELCIAISNKQGVVSICL